MPLVSPPTKPSRLASFWAWVNRLNAAIETTEVDVLERRLTQLETRVAAVVARLEKLEAKD